ncbi:uncharacterized protein IUM83_12471 [Phytophthora cinnamomi]|uniref:uncharacterized protein n=1 Tax=Phytophthora cinnamomi TaxID=4785 RepID=UPI00355996BD|nr:hypothetical protein IUM83_12471 [Phytophthora cinnamomi]
MAASSGLKFVALLTLLLLGMSNGSSDPSRHLRVEQPVTRQLQGKMGWWAVIKTNLVYQPIGSKLYQKLRQIQERVLGKDV